MRKISSLILSAVVLLSFVIISLSVSAMASPQLMVIEWSVEQLDGKVTLYVTPPTDDSETNPDYQLLSYHWFSTANYLINPKNKYGFTTSDVVSTITASANAWDDETSYAVFAYKGTTSKAAGKYDRANVVSWGSYRAGVIAVTYIWSIGSQIVETDMRLNTFYKWTLSGEAGKMDVQNIVTHEFGHWCGLKDLYGDADYWLTMYGYADYGETYKQTVGLGDINGLEAVYGP